MLHLPRNYVSSIANGRNSIFTLAFPGGGHYTYRIKKSEDGGVSFASLLTGPDNSADYTYIGLAFDGRLVRTRKSGYPCDSRPFVLLNRTLANIYEGTTQRIYERGYSLHHAGACLRCNRTLTVPSSIETGYGPECTKILGLEVIDNSGVSSASQNTLEKIDSDS